MILLRQKHRAKEIWQKCPGNPFEEETKLYANRKKRGQALTCPVSCSGAKSGTRTHDLFVTNEMLYRLSYCGDCGAKVILLRIPTNSLAYFFRCNHIFFSPDSPDGFRIGRSTLSSKRANRLTLSSLHSQYPLLKTKRRNELHRPASCCAYIIDRLFGFLPAVSQLQSDMVHVDFGQRRSRDVGNYVGHHLLLVVRVVVIAAAR